MLDIMGGNLFNFYPHGGLPEGQMGDFLFFIEIGRR